MNYRIVKGLMKRYPEIREVVDLANDYNIECEECARIFVALVDNIIKSDGLKEICFKKHYVDGKDFLTIAIEEGVAKSTAHRWVEECECRLATSLSFVRTFYVWVNRHFPEVVVWAHPEVHI